MHKFLNINLMVVFSALLILSSCNMPQDGSNSNNPNSIEIKKTYTRDELKQKVIGLTGAFVIQELGKPDSTSESGGTEYWYYSKISIDEVTGNLDGSVQLIFDSQDKQVSQISF